MRRRGKKKREEEVGRRRGKTEREEEIRGRGKKS